MKYLDVESNRIIDIRSYDVPEYLITLEKLGTLVPMLGEAIVFYCHNGPLIEEGHFDNYDIIEVEPPEGLIIDESTNLYDNWHYDEEKVKAYARTIKSQIEEGSRRKYIVAHLGDPVIEALDKLRIPSLEVTYGHVEVHADGRLIGMYKLAEEDALKDYTEVIKFIEENRERSIESLGGACGRCMWISPGYSAETYLKTKYHLDEVGKIMYEPGNLKLVVFGRIGLRRVVFDVKEPKICGRCEEIFEMIYEDN